MATDGSSDYSGIISIDTYVRAQQLAIIPNPTTGKFHVRTESVVNVYNLLGELIASSNDGEIDLSSYPNGVYLVRSGNDFAKLVLRK